MFGAPMSDAELTDAVDGATIAELGELALTPIQYRSPAVMLNGVTAAEMFVAVAELRSPVEASGRPVGRPLLLA